jgi:hypothetical protein
MHTEAAAMQIAYEADGYSIANLHAEIAKRRAR